MLALPNKVPAQMRINVEAGQRADSSDDYHPVVRFCNLSPMPATPYRKGVVLYMSAMLPRLCRRWQALVRPASLVALTVICVPACALEHVSFMVGTNPGGGYEQAARGLGQAMLDAGVARSVQYENKAGAGGTIALAQFVSNQRGNGNALIVTGAVMIGAILQNKPPVSLAEATPIARLFHEYNVFVVPAASPIKTMKDLLDLFKRDPGSITWGGGSRGSIDQISIAHVARAVGVESSKINYVPFQGGGEASAAIVGEYVTVGASGWAELAPFIKSGKVRALAITAATRLPGNSTPTLKEFGIDVALENWRGIYAAPGISDIQRRAITNAVVAATKQKSWSETVAARSWTPALLTGDAFEKFITEEQVRIDASMRSVGLIR